MFRVGNIEIIDSQKHYLTKKVIAYSTEKGLLYSNDFCDSSRWNSVTQADKLAMMWDPSIIGISDGKANYRQYPDLSWQRHIGLAESSTIDESLLPSCYSKTIVQSRYYPVISKDGFKQLDLYNKEKAFFPKSNGVFQIISTNCDKQTFSTAVSLDNRGSQSKTLFQIVYCDVGNNTLTNKDFVRYSLSLSEEDYSKTFFFYRSLLNSSPTVITQKGIFQ